MKFNLHISRLCTGIETDERRSLYDINGQQRGFEISLEMEKYDDTHSFRVARDQMIKEHEDIYGVPPIKNNGIWG